MRPGCWESVIVILSYHNSKPSSGTTYRQACLPTVLSDLVVASKLSQSGKDLIPVRSFIDLWPSPRRSNSPYHPRLETDQLWLSDSQPSPLHVKPHIISKSRLLQPHHLFYSSDPSLSRENGFSSQSGHLPQYRLTLHRLPERLGQLACQG